MVAGERGLLDNPRSDFAEMAAAHQAVLPQGAAAFIKELMSVVWAQRRCALARSVASGGRAHVRMHVCCGALCNSSSCQAARRAPAAASAAHPSPNPGASPFSGTAATPDN